MPSNIHHDEERGEEGKLQEAEAIVISNVLAPTKIDLSINGLGLWT
jgi:hypothetical protein